MVIAAVVPRLSPCLGGAIAWFSREYVGPRLSVISALIVDVGSP